MQCPKCGGNLKITNTYRYGWMIRRRKQCCVCGHITYTREQEERPKIKLPQ